MTAGYAVSYVNGTLNVTRREVIMTSATDSKQYDGTPLTNSTVTVTGDGFAEGEGAAYEVTGTRTLVGTNQNVFTYTLNEGTKPANYNIVTRPGTLTIVNREAKYEIEVEGVSQTVTYNGREQTAEGLITTTFTVDGHVYTVEGLTASASGTDAGEYPMNVVGTPVVRDSEGNDVTGEFAIVTRNGTLTIAPKAVTITANDASRMYDGTALTESGFTASALEAGDLHTFTVAMTDDSTITNAGTQPNVIRTVDGTAVTTGTETRVGNYLVTTADGTLEVTKRTVILTSGSSEKEYDGTPMTDGTVTEGGDGFVEGEGATYDVTGSQTDAGESKNTFTYTLNEGTNADNYEIITEEGTLRGLPNPTPITVTITGHQETLVYDGQIHTVTGYDVSISSELYTEADFSFSGSAEVSDRQNRGQLRHEPGGRQLCEYESQLHQRDLRGRGRRTGDHTQAAHHHRRR